MGDKNEKNNNDVFVNSNKSNLNKEQLEIFNIITSHPHVTNPKIVIYNDNVNVSEDREIILNVGPNNSIVAEKQNVIYWNLKNKT